MTDTITALATPAGTAGLAVIRISGPDAISIADSCFKGNTKLEDAKTQTLHYGLFTDKERYIDTVVVAIFRNPISYTGEDVVEISCHGGMIVVEDILNTIIKSGARYAHAGEFTKRAFLNGKLNLLQVEAVADIIHSDSVKGVQTAARQLIDNFTERLMFLRKELIDAAGLLELELDFAEEDIELMDRTKIRNLIENDIQYCSNLRDSYKSSEILRSGYYVGIAGYPNSGKSTLFNSLLKKQRAIVSHIPGTTRDYIEETIFIDGVSIKLFDTAGIRETDDIIEIEGIKFVESILNQSNLVIILNDISVSHENSDVLYKQIKEKYPDCDVILVHNKTDKTNLETPKDPNSIYISAKSGYGIDEIRSYLSNKAKESSERVSDILINQRHSVILNRIVSELEQTLIAIDINQDNVIIAIELRKAISSIGELTGEIWSEDIINNIFSRFCIGK